MFASPQVPAGWRLLSTAYRLPGWLALLGALVAYLFFHPAAQLQETGAPGDPFDALLFGILRFLSLVATLGQFLVPGILIALAALKGIWFLKAWFLRRRLAEGMRALTWEAIAFLVALDFHRRGFQVIRIEESLSRLGFDLEARKGSERHLIQVRNWRVSRYGRSPLETLFGHLKTVRRDRLAIYISGRFSREARAFAQGRPIQLVDGETLQEHILRADPSGREGTLPALGRWLAHWRDSRLDSGWLGRTRPSPPRVPEDPAEARALRSLEATISQDRPTPVPDRSNRAIRPDRPDRINPLLQSGKEGLDRLILGEFSWKPLLDGLGMVLALVLGGSAYRAFLDLPPDRALSPWSRLGTAPELAVVKALVPQRDAVALGDLAGRPLGQFQEAAPPETPGGAEPWLSRSEEEAIPPETPEPIQSLKAAFEAQYVPPPACFDPAPRAFVACANHRMRAERAFFAAQDRKPGPSVEAQPPAPEPQILIEGPEAEQPIPDWRRTSSLGNPWRAVPQAVPDEPGVGRAWWSDRVQPYDAWSGRTAPAWTQPSRESPPPAARTWRENQQRWEERWERVPSDQAWEEPIPDWRTRWLERP